MSSSRPQPGSRDSEAYELVSPEAAHSINPNGEPSVRSLDNDARPAGVNRRHRLSHSRSEQAADHVEAVGLLSRSPFANFKPPARGSGLHTALELVTQSTPSLFAAVVGSVMTGFVFDQVQFWPAFVRIQELFILVPVLLNLKGCLEMNLASRLSTSANIGELDIRRTRRAIVIGNLALLQVQTLLIGALAGLLAFVLGYFVKPHRETWFETALMIVSSMLCASLSSVVLSSFMSSLVLVSRRFRINPDNIATPLASSFGDLLTLIILTFLTSLLVNVISTYWATALLILLGLAVPGFIVLVWKNPYVSELLFEGWTATILSTVISSGSGVLLQRFVKQYDALPLILPVTSSLAGNVGCTQLAAGANQSIKSRDNMIVMSTLFAISIPIHLAFLGFIHLFGTFEFGFLFLFGYLIVGGLSIAFALCLAFYISKLCWNRGYNPDNFVLGLIAAITDVVTTILLVIVFKISSTA